MVCVYVQVKETGFSLEEYVSRTLRGVCPSVKDGSRIYTLSSKPRRCTECVTHDYGCKCLCCALPGQSDRVMISPTLDLSLSFQRSILTDLGPVVDRRIAASCRELSVMPDHTVSSVAVLLFALENGRV
ncbi:hypothetical protein J6590_079279 [Homalodisca vitripennis]|nr:hypothetical protein J6590_079279 [Homalodisca vitripennis]